MVFNVLARNQDDHTRNIAFLLEQNEPWRLSPAFDVIRSFNPSGRWTNRHQTSVNGKRDDFTRADLATVARRFGIKDDRDLIEQVATAVSAGRVSPGPPASAPAS